MLFTNKDFFLSFEIWVLFLFISSPSLCWVEWWTRASSCLCISRRVASLRRMLAGVFHRHLPRVRMAVWLEAYCFYYERVRLVSVLYFLYFANTWSLASTALVLGSQQASPHWLGFLASSLPGIFHTQSKDSDVGQCSRRPRHVTQAVLKLCSSCPSPRNDCRCSPCPATASLISAPSSRCPHLCVASYLCICVVTH